MFGGCGQGGTPSGCPEDLSIPKDATVLGANHDAEVFVLRLRTVELPMKEVVLLFRDTMTQEGWKIKTDSATDKNGGELIYQKEEENRICRLFISRYTGKDAEPDSVNIEIKCDRAKPGQ